jgi:hypothetical protein
VTCPICRSTYTGLACGVCLAKTGRLEILKRQADYLDAVRSKRLVFKLSQDTIGSHLVAFGDPTLSYCGKVLKADSKRRDRTYGGSDWRAGVCGACLIAFDKIAGVTR